MERMSPQGRRIFWYYSVLSRTRIARIYTDSGCGRTGGRVAFIIIYEKDHINKTYKT